VRPLARAWPARFGAWRFRAMAPQGQRFADRGRPGSAARLAHGLQLAGLPAGEHDALADVNFARLGGELPASVHRTARERNI